MHRINISELVIRYLRRVHGLWYLCNTKIALMQLQAPQIRCRIQGKRKLQFDLIVLSAYTGHSALVLLTQDWLPCEW